MDQPCEPLSVVSLSLTGDLKDKPPPFPPSSGAVCLTSWPSSPLEDGIRQTLWRQESLCAEARRMDWRN